MKKGLILVLAALVVGFIGCVKDLSKENFSETTTLIGRVIEESTQRPVADVKVSITNGSRTYASYTTKEDGNFELQVNFDKLGKDYYLLMDGGTAIKTKKSELRGMGMEMYDYTDIILYNSIETDGLSVVSFEITSFTAYSAGCKAEIIAGTDVNVTKRGFCWSSSNQNPTISNHAAEYGSGIGEYTGIISGLTEMTKYYVRAYAQTVDTVVYSEMKSITTAPILPTFQYEGHTFYVAPDPGIDLQWEAAKSYCNNLTFQDLTGWRMPTCGELVQMYANKNTIKGFDEVKYWSSTYHHSSYIGGYGNVDFYYSVDFANGVVSNSTFGSLRIRPIKLKN